MSALIETLILCDGHEPDCHGTYAQNDARHQTASRQREGYAADGWHFVGGKDFCPVCWEVRKQARKS